MFSGAFFSELSPKSRQKTNLTRFSVKFLQINFVSSSQIFRAVLLHKFSMIFCLFHSVSLRACFCGEKAGAFGDNKRKVFEKAAWWWGFFGVSSGLFECWGEKSVFFAVGFKLKTCKVSPEKPVILLFRSGISVRHRGRVFFLRGRIGNCAEAISAV